MHTAPCTVFMVQGFFCRHNPTHCASFASFLPRRKDGPRQGRRRHTPFLRTVCRLRPHRQKNALPHSPLAFPLRFFCIFSSQKKRWPPAGPPEAHSFSAHSLQAPPASAEECSPALPSRFPIALLLHLFFPEEKKAPGRAAGGTKLLFKAHLHHQTKRTLFIRVLVFFLKSRLPVAFHSPDIGLFRVDKKFLGFGMFLEDDCRHLP